MDFTPVQRGWAAFIGLAPHMDWLVVSVLAAGVLIATAWFIGIQKAGDRGPTACIFIFVLFNVFFWTGFEQAGSTFNVFARDATDRVILGWEMPATWLQSVNSILIFVLAPLFAWLWSRLGKLGLDPSQPVKIGLGLLFLGAGYLFIVAGARLNSTGVRVSLFWLFATYVFHTFGELCLSPTGLSFVTKTAPVRFVSFLMGIWFISSFVAGLGGGIIASHIEQVARGELFRPILGGRADYFLIFVISSIGAGLVILLLTPLLKRLLRSRG
jgi:POT family proton-dependent oligopeptide transporter